jgi:hypothetical protein
VTTHEPTPHDEVGRGHEPDHISTRGVLTIGAVLVATIVGTLAFLGFLHERLRSPDPSAPTGVSTRRMTEPLAPEHDQPALLRALREYEAQTLQEYAWQDEAKSAARIPVERAMAILLEEGFPVEPAPQSTTPQSEEGASPSADAQPPADSPTPTEPNISADPTLPTEATPAQTAPAEPPSEIPPPAETPPDAPQENANEPQKEGVNE